MNGGYQVPVRLVIILSAILIAILFTLGLMRWDPAPYSCFSGRHYYGNWIVVWKVSHVEFRTKAWGCETSDRYDPKIFHPL